MTKISFAFIASAIPTDTSDADTQEDAPKRHFPGNSQDVFLTKNSFSEACLPACSRFETCIRNDMELFQLPGRLPIGDTKQSRGSELPVNQIVRQAVQEETDEGTLRALTCCSRYGPVPMNFMTPCAVSSQISLAGRSIPTFLTLASVAYCDLNVQSPPWLSISNYLKEYLRSSAALSSGED